VGAEPRDSVYDVRNGFVYIPNLGTSNVTVIFDRQVVGTVAVGRNPSGAMYDGQNGYVYVLNPGSKTVSVLSGTQLVGTVSVGSGSDYAVYDPSSGYAYVTNSGTKNVSVINGTTLVGSIEVGSNPFGAAYDSANGDVYVANQGSQNVSVISGMNVVASLPAGKTPYWVTYDSGTGDLYVANEVSDNVSVIRGTTVVGSVNVGTTPDSVTYDSANGDVYVVNGASDNVSVINGTKLIRSVAVGATPLYADFDSANSLVYVVNRDSGTVTAINGTKAAETVTVGASPYFPVYDSGNGLLYVPNDGSETVTAIVTGAVVTFTEQGLPTGSGWWVNVSIASTGYSNATTLWLGAPNGTFSYFASTNDRNYTSTVGSFTVDLGVSLLSETVPFPLRTFPVSFVATGLPTRTSWSVTVGNATFTSLTSTIVCPEANGSYTYVLGIVAGWTPSNATGAFTVDGAPVSERVEWRSVTYPVTFAESTLPAGTGWWVNVTGNISGYSVTTSLTVQAPNGTLGYLVATSDKSYASPAGNLVVGGQPVVLELPFYLVTFEVTFAAVGLPAGHRWSVGLYTTQQATSSSVDSFREPNGTYPFDVQLVPGYTVTPSSGTVVVDGASITRTINFSAAAPPTYAVSFSSRGLPGGTSWSVILGGLPETGNGTLLFPGLVNGSYPFTVEPVPGYAATPSSGSVTVNGNGTSVLVEFASPAAVPTILGLPSGEGYAVLGGCLVVVAVVVAALALGRRKPTTAPPGQEAPTPPPPRDVPHFP
jgi:YVTN family beta-propeller protein